MADYKSSDLQRLFNRSGATIRSWAVEFAEHLSPTATPEEGKQRTYTHADLEIMALISEMKNKSATFEDIHAALQAGQRGSIEDRSIQAALSTDGIVALDSARQMIVSLRADLEDLQAERDTLHDDNIRLQTQLDDRDKRIEELEKDRQRLEELQKQIGRLEARIEIMKEQADDE